MTGIEGDKTVTTTQAASILGVSRATVVRFCNEGRLPYAQPGSHRILRLADVLELKAATTHGQDAATTRFVKCGPTPNGLMCACGGNVGHERAQGSRS